MPSSILDLLNGVERTDNEPTTRVRLGSHLNSSNWNNTSQQNDIKKKNPKQLHQHSISSFFQNSISRHNSKAILTTPCRDDANSSWSCGVCTFYMEDSTSNTCHMCGSKRPRPIVHQSPTYSSSSSSPSSKKRRRVIVDDDDAEEEDNSNEDNNDSDMRFAQKLQEAELLSRKYYCGICLDNDVKLEDMVSLSCQPIAHKYCRDCFIDYCSNKISERITDIHCPEVKCRCEITFWELQGNLPADIMKKYERFSIRNVCEQNGYIHCPRCNEWFADVNLADTPQAEAIWKKVCCGKCSHEFCGKCGEAPHKSISVQRDITCTELARELSKSNNDALMLELAGNKGYKKCPCCNALTELVEDCCKFVYCRCGKKFCFLCEMELTDKDHYNHFRGKPGW